MVELQEPLRLIVGMPEDVGLEGGFPACVFPCLLPIKFLFVV